MFLIEIVVIILPYFLSKYKVCFSTPKSILSSNFLYPVIEETKTPLILSPLPKVVAFLDFGHAPANGKESLV